MTGRWRWVAYRLRAMVGRPLRQADLDEELRFHLEEESERLEEEGVPQEAARRAARRSLGSPTAIRERTRDVWTWPRLEQLRRDVGFGWRQVARARMRSAAAILSLALALGACAATFMVIDALLFRPLPVDGAERLYVLTRTSASATGETSTFDGVEYPLFEQMRDDVAGVDVLAVSFATSTDLTYRSDQEMERAHVQYVSGATFDTFGLRPALGRLLGSNDDRVPGGHPQAVLSHAYWMQRFDGDPQVLGRSLRIGRLTYEIIGVVAAPFVGTEPGVVVDVFLPAMMHDAVANTGSTWLRVLARLPPGGSPSVLRERLQARLTTYQRTRAASFGNLPPHIVERLLSERVGLEPATAGASALQGRYRDSLIALAALVGLVLLVACANVANLMIARTASRSREMAIRCAIGAGRGSLLQLVLAESAWIAGLAAALGTLFAVVAAPHVVARVNPPDAPAHLQLALDWRAVIFVVAMTAAVTLVFGIASALVTVRVSPVSALRGGQTPRSYHGLMRGLVMTQVAFCFLVVFVSGLFVTTLTRLTQQDLGFSTDRLLVLNVRASDVQPPHLWEQLARQLRSVPGVQEASVGDAALLDGSSWNTTVTLAGDLQSELTFMRAVSPGWLETMGLPLLAGRDLQSTERHPQVAIVNEAFARTFFDGANPVGRTFAIGSRAAEPQPVEIVGLTRDARYRNLRDPAPPVAYVPFALTRADGTTAPKLGASVVVRTSMARPLDVAATLRAAVARDQPALYVSSIRTQEEIVAAQSIRERLIAVLSGFFAGLALLLSAVGLYGVLDYSVLQRRRDIGICLALGAPVVRIVRMVFAGLAVMVGAGAVLGMLIGVWSARPLETLLFGVAVGDPSTLLTPAVTVLAIVLIACLPPLVRAVRTDPTATLRAQ